MANGVFHTKYGIEINLTHEDLGHEDRPGLLAEITRSVGERPRDLLQCLQDYKGGSCGCAQADKSSWMFVRRQRRDGRLTLVAAHLPMTHVATPQESDRHKAMKERIARTASRHGLDVQVEVRSTDRRIVTDVLISGPAARVGWEAQYSPISASTAHRRSAHARANGIAPLWITGDPASALIDRAPWARVDDVPWQRIVSPLAMIVRGGVRHLQIWKCTPASERPCPETGQVCGRFHSGWFLPALCIPEERSTALDELVVTSADGEHLPLRIRDRSGSRRVSHLWALAADVYRWRELTGQTDAPAEATFDDEETLSFTQEDLDGTCRYAEEGTFVSDPRPRRELASATGLRSFDHVEDIRRPQSRPVRLQLTENERRVISIQLRCPPWEIGPCINGLPLLYHQQTKNLLVSYSPKKPGFF
ncbi:hypothetical protein [Streptomyces sp. BP-8]|uniref:Competence protein CoiA nuclease-like domain-containing protein n=1 Tax=Streptomyces sirii TaxID=3127701 RepID=A0ABZ2QWJ7_9ACTN